jgi:hypothetical protein
VSIDYCGALSSYTGALPHDTSFADETISTELDDDGMAGGCSSEVASDDSSAGNDGLAAEDNILRASDGRSTRDLVTRILNGVILSILFFFSVRDLTVSMYSERE